MPPRYLCCSNRLRIPDGKDTTSLGETGLLLDTTDPLLEDRGDLGGSSLGLSGIAADLLGRSVEDGGSGSGLFGRRENLSVHVLAKLSERRQGITIPSTQPSSSARAVSRAHWSSLRCIGATMDAMKVLSGRLTEARRDCAETAPTERVDWRRAFLNMVDGCLPRKIRGRALQLSAMNRRKSGEWVVGDGGGRWKLWRFGRGESCECWQKEPRVPLT
jgi:hypothetical protein